MFGLWVVILAVAPFTVQWIGRWSIALPLLGTLIIFVMEARIGARQVIWMLLTAHCPHCGAWPMKYKGTPDNSRGFLICENCQIEWDLGRGIGLRGDNYDLTSIAKSISDIIDKHIKENDPPETQQTLERLTKEGRTMDEARQLISSAVAVEIFHIYCERKPNDPKRYAWNLARLPQEPWDAQGREIYRASR